MKKIECEVYSRVVGYFRPVKNWNLGKVAEFNDRVPYDIRVAEMRALLQHEGVFKRKEFAHA